VPPGLTRARDGVRHTFPVPIQRWRCPVALQVKSVVVAAAGVVVAGVFFPLWFGVPVMVILGGWGLGMAVRPSEVVLDPDAGTLTFRVGLIARRVRLTNVTALLADGAKVTIARSGGGEISVYAWRKSPLDRWLRIPVVAGDVAHAISQAVTAAHSAAQQPATAGAGVRPAKARATVRSRQPLAVILLGCAGVLAIAAALLVRVSWPSPVMTALGVLLALALGVSGLFYVLFACWLLVTGRVTHLSARALPGGREGRESLGGDLSIAQLTCSTGTRRYPTTPSPHDRGNLRPLKPYDAAYPEGPGPQPRTACCACATLSVHHAREEVPVMAGSGDELAAGTGDRSRLRASDADRERVAEVLKTAFVQGRLTMDEFALRVTRAYASRTYADLDALTADIPARLTKAQPPMPAPEPAPDPDRKKLIQRGTAAGAAAGMAIPAVAITVAGGSPVFALVFGVALSTVLAVLLPGCLTLLSRVLDKDTGEQPFQGPPPSACGQAYQPLPPAGPARPRPQISPEPPRAAEARPHRHPRRPLPGLLAGPGLRPAPRTTAA
jgi:hypothetical protein